MRREVLSLLEDALLASQRISDKISEFSLGEYEHASWETKAAVERQYELLGEALNYVRNADAELAERIPGVEAAIGVRNHIIHGYFEGDDETLWQTATEDLPQLQQALLHLLIPR